MIKGQFDSNKHRFCCSKTKPNQTKPNQTKTNLTTIFSISTYFYYTIQFVICGKRLNSKADCQPMGSTELFECCLFVPINKVCHKNQENLVRIG